MTIACADARLGLTDKALKVYGDAKANGVSTTERRFGIRELQRFLKSGKPTAAIRTAVQKRLDQFIGPDLKEPLGGGRRSVLRALSPPPRVAGRAS